MSARALNWAFDQEPDTATQKLVLICLGDRADEDGECWPSLHWISQKCGPVSEQAAKRALTALCQQGYLEKVERRRRSNQTLGTWLLRLSIDRATGHQRPLAKPEPQVTSELTEEPSSKELSVRTEVLTAESTPKRSPQTVLAWFIDEARSEQIPMQERVIGQLARFIGEAFKEGVAADEVEAGLTLMAQRRMMRPALLSQFIAEAAMPARVARPYGYGVTAGEMVALAERLEAEGQ